MRPLRVTVLLLASVLAGCMLQEPEPPKVIPPPPEDLSHWQVPTLLQPPPALAPEPSDDHKPTPAEKVYDFTPGGTYKVPVSLNFPLDIVLERGETRLSIAGGDPEPVEQGQQAVRWEVKEGKSGEEGAMQGHIFVRATEPGLEMGLVITTTKRVYYVTCASVKGSPIRALRWTYRDNTRDRLPRPEPSLLPDPTMPRQYHVGYRMEGSQPVPSWAPRSIVDDGAKLYLVYPEVTLFQTVPLVRALGVQGPQVTNARQILNVVMLDSLPQRVELRVGVDGTDHPAEIVTITQGKLRTIDCPGDPDCPPFPTTSRR